MQYKKFYRNEYLCVYKLYQKYLDIKNDTMLFR